MCAIDLTDFLNQRVRDYCIVGSNVTEKGPSRNGQFGKFRAPTRPGVKTAAMLVKFWYDRDGIGIYLENVG